MMIPTVEQIRFSVDEIRQDFPILLSHTKQGKPLVYLDNAATTQKPNCVIQALINYYQQYNANVHRSAHALSDRATHEFELARKKIQKFLHANSAREIVFTRGTTEAINLVAQSYGRNFLTTQNEILISTMEHHSNIVPWQLLTQQIGCTLRIIPIHDDGTLDLSELNQLLTSKTKILALNHISNSLGTINPIKQLIHAAHAVGAVVLIDGAQAAAHTEINVAELDCDFYTVSGHKMFGPTGIGALYAKEQLLEKMPPYHGGGEMIRTVRFEKTTFNEIPYKFEAGTPNIADAIALGAAIDYLSQFNKSELQQHEHDLLNYATKNLQAIPGLKIIGNAANKAAIISFIMDGVHPHDIGTILDHQGVCIRTGHHCTMPLMERLGLPATARASFAFYNTRTEVDALVNALARVYEVFRL